MEVLIVIAVAAVGWYFFRSMRSSPEETQERKELEAKRDRAQAQRESKRSELKRLQVQSEGEKRFLDPGFRETYAHEHYDEVRSGGWKKMLAEYAHWEADPEFSELISEISGGKDMLRVWKAKREVKTLADGLTERERGTRRKIELAEFDKDVEKHERSLHQKEPEPTASWVPTIEELDEVEAGLKKMEESFLIDVHNCTVVGGRQLHGRTQTELDHELAMASLDARDEHPEIEQLTGLKLTWTSPEAILADVESPGAKEAGIVLGLYYGELARTAIRNEPENLLELKKAERALLGTLREYFESDQACAQICAQAEAHTFELFERCVDQVTNARLEEHKTTGSDEIFARYMHSWGADCRNRFWKQRSEDGFLRILQAAQKEPG